MQLSWNEIRDRARKFSREWAEEGCEDAGAKSFWDAFFNVFGVSRRPVAAFERKVRKLDERRQPQVRLHQYCNDFLRSTASRTTLIKEAT